MSKVIVVKDCDNCPKASISLANNNKFCHSDFDKLCPRIGIPDWCPLPDLPEKQYGSLFIGTSLEPLYDSFRDGWNACLNVIMGGEEK